MPNGADISMKECEDLEDDLKFHAEVLGFDVVMKKQGWYYLRRGDAELILVPEGTIDVHGDETPSVEEEKVEYPAIIMSYPVKNIAKAVSHLKYHKIILENEWKPGDKEVNFLGPDGREHYSFYEDEEGIDLSYNEELHFTLFVIIGDYASSIQSLRKDILDSYNERTSNLETDIWKDLFNDFLRYSTKNVRIYSNSTWQAVINDIKEHYGLKRGYDVYIYELFTNRDLLKENIYVGDSGVSDGDYLVMRFSYVGASRCDLLPYEDSPGITSHLVENISALKATSEQKYLVGILLYTEEDHELARYVRMYYRELNKMTSNNLKIYVLEKKPSKLKEALIYWERALETQIDKRVLLVWAFLKWINSRPVDKSQAYEIVRSLGLYPDQMPCLILLSNFKKPKHEAIIVSIDSSTDAIRHLFSNILRILDEFRDKDEYSKDDEFKSLKSGLNKIYKKKLLTMRDLKF